MSRQDSFTKAYISQPEICADLFNKMLYHGEQRIRPEQLVPLDTTELALPYGAGTGAVPAQKFRDVLKGLVAMKDEQAAYVCILGVENQTEVHYAAPVKGALCDLLNLSSQVQKATKSHKESKDYGSRAEFLSGFHKDDRLLPVITIFLHWQPEPWDGPLSLRDMYACEDETILAHAIDYHINLITPDALTDNDLAEFHSSLREAMLFVRDCKDKQKITDMLENNSNFQNIDHLLAELLREVTGVKLNLPKGKEKINMKNAWNDAIEESRKEGQLEGRKEGRKEGEQFTALSNIRGLMASTSWTAQQAMDAMRLTPEQQKELAPLI